MAGGEFDLRKGIHIKLLPNTKNEFRVVTFRLGLSMQEVMEELANRCVQEDPRIMRILNELVEQKKERVREQLSPTDAEAIFDAIEMENPE